VIEDALIAVAVLALVWAALVIGLVLAGRGGHARELTAFLPNLVRLFRGLSGDRRVPRRAKAALGFGALYFALTVDLIPDFIPVIGQADDAIVAALVLRYVLGTTERAVLYEHWRGDARTLDRLLALVRA
jgi:uncharacterized membrane protein YkvA (DUF1232 family)